MKYSPCRPLASTILVAAIALVSPLLSGSAHAALITNGGFEDNVIYDSGDGSGGTTAVTGAATSLKYGDLNNWATGTSTNTNVFATNDLAYFPLGGPGPHSGDLAAVFSATGVPYDGYITQVTSAIATKWYTVGFWVSTQGVGAFDPADNFLTVNWGATSVSPSAVIGGSNYLPGAIPVPTGWTHLQFDVLSAGADRLSFIAGGAAGQEILLDDVTLVDAVPEVSSFGMLTGLGLLAFGAAARIRRRAFLTA